MSHTDNSKHYPHAAVVKLLFFFLRPWLLQTCFSKGTIKSDAAIPKLFHNSSALLHALTLLTMYTEKGEVIDINAHAYICLCVYACHTGFVYEVRKEPERELISIHHPVIVPSEVLSFDQL